LFVIMIIITIINTILIEICAIAIR